MSLTPEEKRRRRIQELAAKLKSNGLSDLTAIEGWGGLKWGCRRERVREYVEVVEAAGLVDVFKGEIRWVGP